MSRVVPIEEEWADAHEEPLSSPRSQTGSPLQEWLFRQPTYARRACLPVPKQERPHTVSIMQLMKDVFGKHALSRIPVPVQFHEPITELQQRAEDMQYSELLDKARDCGTGSLERLAYVAAFSMTAYAGLYRDNKPFFSVMGETYELVCPEKGFRLMSEKVQHEPMAIGHTVCEGTGWQWELEDELRMRFTGTSIEIVPAVLMKVTFEDGDSYEYHKAVTSINNLLLGKLYVDHKGSWTVTHCQSGKRAHMTFLPPLTSMYSRLKRDRRHVEGHFEQHGVQFTEMFLKGKCDESLYLEHSTGRVQCIWKAAPLLKDPGRFNFATDWNLLLNQMPEELRELLPHTDARFRPDVRLLEQGIYDEAQVEKVRLERKQDGAHASGSQPPQPRWFEPIPGVDGSSIGKKFLFRYKGGYWEARDSGSIKAIPNPYA